MINWNRAFKDATVRGKRSGNTIVEVKGEEIFRFTHTKGYSLHFVFARVKVQNQNYMWINHLPLRMKESLKRWVYKELRAGDRETKNEKLRSAAEQQGVKRDLARSDRENALRKLREMNVLK